MGGAVTRGLVTARVWSMLQEGPMSSDELYAEYIRCYEQGKAVDKPSTFTQIVKRCGLVKKIGEREVSTLYYSGLKTRMVSVWVAKTIEELVDPYLNSNHQLRKLSRMPKFVRDAVKDARGELNEA